MQEQKAAAAASEAALQERMEGEMTKQKAEAKAHLAETVRDWEDTVRVDAEFVLEIAYDCHREVFFVFFSSYKANIL